MGETGWAYDTTDKTWRPPSSLGPHNHIAGTDVLIPPGSVTSSMILDGTIVSADIADGTILAADHASEAWTNWTPSLTASVTSPTLGTASIQDGRYYRLSRMLNGWAYVQFGTSGAVAGSGEYRISLPVTPVTSTRNVIVGCGYLYDSSANTLEQVVLTVPANQTFTIMFKNGAFQVTDAAPWVWAANDQLSVNFCYEAAS